VKTGTVTSAAIMAEPGQPFSAEFWLTRRDGEGYPAWLARQKMVKRLRVSRNQLAEALANLDEHIKEMSDS
jgi:hypothetical protein